MAENTLDVSLKAQLEEAERRGREEGHKKGMADMFALLSAAGDQQEYFVAGVPGCPQIDGETIFKNRVDAAMRDAAKQNQTELVLFLLKAGAGVNSRSGEDSCTALHCAVQEGHTEMVKTLLKAGADPNVDNYGIVTSLALAVEHGHTEIAKALLAAGADVFNGEAPEHADWLIKYEAEGDQVEMTQTLLEAGAYIGPDRGNYNWTPLMLAAYFGKTKAAALLINAGCDVNAKNDDDGNSVLMMAARGKNEGSIDIIRLLLKSGAEINYQNEEGRTALMCAADEGRSEAVRLLLSAGADVFSRAQVTPEENPDSGKLIVNAFDVATDDAVKEIITSEMHQRIAAALSVLHALPVEVRQKIIQLSLEN